MHDPFIYFNETPAHTFIAYDNGTAPLTLKLEFPVMPAREALAADFDKLSRMPDLLSALRALPDMLAACVELRDAGKVLERGDTSIEATARYFIATDKFDEALRKAGAIV